MAVLDDTELAILKIERMVFHIVGPRPEHFQRLVEISPGEFEDFFADRIRSASRGNSYLFSDKAQTQSRLLSILMNTARFQEESEKLAEDFQRAHGGQTAPGAFMVFLLRCGARRAFALMKYDDNTVLTYQLEDAAAGRKKAKLESLQRNFVKDPSALQKAALITLDPEPGVLNVMDRRNGAEVARYFELFLGAKREFDHCELTKRIVDAAISAVLDNQDLVPPEVYREARRRAYNAAAGGGEITPDSSKTFLEAMFGTQLDDDDPIVRRYQTKLRVQRIQDESFKLDPTGLKRPRRRNIETSRGVRVTFPEELNDLVTVDRENGRITISDKIIRDDVENLADPRTGRTTS